ncbi:hypothetical protein HYH03_004277 [Edaphochlamys debaryana]|uniref:Uncharacterized protein n=1 Tax=Edaphochlamys debaryana TaxID=47281 RepID=A0A835YI14_9CHLO|nr:hypothetical protein HYH03_004277 [Edaphochlamys debaryana]|eukprot:KAG2498019.1 hypothetical protein HYH03_004277 [Edaphochlamys debaryana]
MRLRLRLALMLALVLGLTVDGRVLVVQQASSMSDGGMMFMISEEQSAFPEAQGPEDSQQSAELIIGTPFSSFYSPFAWFQQQLMIVDALQRAAFAGLGPAFLEESESAVEPSQADMLRKVGCARMRASMAQKVQQQSMMEGASTSASAAAYPTGASSSASSSSAAATAFLVDPTYHEFYEDYERVEPAAAVNPQLYGGRGAGAGVGVGVGVGPGGGAMEQGAVSEQATDQAADRIVALLQNAYGQYLAYGDDAVAQPHAGSAAKARHGKGSGSAAAVLENSWYEVFNKQLYEDDSYDEYEVVTDDDDEEYLLDSLFYDDNEYTEDDEYDDDYTFTLEYDEDLESEYREALDLADSLLSELGSLDDADEEWADYLQSAYEYYTYDEPYLVFVDASGAEAALAEASMLRPPNPLEVLAHLAELLAWSHAADGAVQIVQYNVQDADGVQVQHTTFMYPAEDAWEPLPGEPWVGLQPSPGLEVEDDLDLSWFSPDGSVNWGLIMLCILAAGTLAVLCGFVVSFIALRRSMGATWVFVPCRAPRRAGKGCGDAEDLDAPLVLQAEECYGGVPVESAAAYVPPVLPNESVAKALYN